jgi:hypothetical protein
MNTTEPARCFYCDRPGQQLEPCCERHPGDLVCADRDGCRDFILAALKAAPTYSDHEPYHGPVAGDDDPYVNDVIGDLT